MIPHPCPCATSSHHCSQLPRCPAAPAADDRFIIKTMKKSEIKLLFELLPKYVRHIRMYPHTLLTRFYGVHRIVPADGRAVRFVVMGNIFRR